MALNEGLKTGDWIGPTIGDKPGRYEVLQILGRGGMGEVCLARDHHMHREVAVKVIHFTGLIDPSTREAYVERFTREARVTAGLDSPFVVKVHDYAVEHGMAYLTMEWLKGQDMDHYLAGLSERRVGPEGFREFSGYIAKAAHGIAKAHFKGVIHRDIKPSNLFLVNREEGVGVNVVDFGIARVTQDAAQSPDHKGTAANVFVGTVEYMSPEQISRPAGVEITGATDVFSLGAVVFQAMTGRSPYNPISSGAPTSGNGSMDAIGEMFLRMKAMKETASQEAGRLPKHLSSATRAFIMRMLHLDPKKRPTAIEVSHFFSEQAGIARFTDPSAPTSPVSIVLTAGINVDHTADDPDVHGRATPQTPKPAPQLADGSNARPPTLAAITADARIRGLPGKLPFTKVQLMAGLAAIFIGVLFAAALEVRRRSSLNDRQLATRPPVVTSIVVDASLLTTTDASSVDVPNVEPDAGRPTFALSNEDAGRVSTSNTRRRPGRHAPIVAEPRQRNARQALAAQCCEGQDLAEVLGVRSCPPAARSREYRRLQCGRH